MADRSLRVVLLLGPSEGGIGAHVRSVAVGLHAAGDRVVVAGPQQTLQRFGFADIGVDTIATSGRRLPARLLLASADADLVHAHGFRAGVTALRLQRRCDTPAVVTWHNAVLGAGLRSRLHRVTQRRLARGARVTLGASSDLVDLAMHMGSRDARLAPVAAPLRVAAPVDPAALRRSLGIAPDRPMVLAVGRLAPQKNYPLLLDAAARWAQRRVAPLVVIAGEGPLRGVLQEHIDRTGLPVRLLGQRDDAPELIAAADVVVLTSIWEARALVAQEALRAGTPLVAMRVGGLPELVGDAALLVASGDADELARAVAMVLDDDDLRQRLATAGREQAGRWPTPADTVAALRAVYSDVGLRR